MTVLLGLELALALARRQRAVVSLVLLLLHTLHDGQEAAENRFSRPGVLVAKVIFSQGKRYVPI